MKKIAWLGVAVLLLAGCAYDADPPMFEVKNLTTETLTVRAVANKSLTFEASPDELLLIPVNPEGCGTFGWSATNDSGATVAEVPGGCRGHRWTIRGVNDSTYK